MFHKICLIIACVGVMLTAGCEKKEEKRAILSHDAKVTVSSDHDVNSATYRLPEGAFCGFWWEFKDDHAFKIDMRRQGGRDYWIYIPVPDEFLKYDEKETTTDWDFKWNENIKEGLISYLISNKQKNISLEVELPFENGKYYAISTLTNHLGEEMIVFGNGSDYLIHKNDNGIFGYILVHSQK